MIVLGHPVTGLVRVPHHPSCPGRRGQRGCICPSSAAGSDLQGKGMHPVARALPSKRVITAPGRWVA